MNSNTAAILTSTGNKPAEITGQDTANTEEVIDLAQYWRTILRHKWGIFSITIVCLIIGTLLALSATPIYRASSTILADPNQPSANNQNQYVNTALVFLFYETQQEIIRSRSVAESVVDKLDLINKFKAEQKEAPEASGLMPALKTWVASIAGGSDTEKANQDKEISDDQLRINIAEGLQAKLDVNVGKKSQIINISYQSPNAQEATDIVNAVASAYIEFGLTSRLGEIKKTVGWLSEQLSQLKTRLQASETKLQDYRQREGMVDTAQQQRSANTQLQVLNSELIRAQTHKSELGTRYRQIKNLKNQANSENTQSAVLNSKTIQDMVREESRLSRKVEELLDRYGEKHPKMIAARSDLRSAENNLQREVNKINDGIEKEYSSAVTQVSNIHALINKHKQELGSLQGANFILSSLERDVENNRRIYESFLSRLMEADVSGQYDASNVRIIDTATVPSAPFKPNKKLMIAISIVLGMFLGVLLAFLREALDNTFKTSDTIEERLGLPFLGLTQMVKSGKNETPPEQQFLSNSRSPFAESINSIRTSLLFSNIDNPPQVILVTSATGSEGKSTLAINLAASLSQMDKTLLLEVDLRKPSLSRNLDTQKSLGLCDLLAGQAKASDVISLMGNDDTKLHIMNCGTLPPNPLELLSSNRFAEVLASLKDHYRYIVMDGPPTLPVSDATVLGHLSDATILTVKAEGTSIKVAQEARSQLQKLGVKVTGAVLSQAEPQRMSYYGDHYYTGDYYGHDNDKKNSNKETNNEAPRGATA
ncbi:MAG: polysaccharide biosynthesis tyrosine autokinase [Flavobacteriales bacterium]|nr:polysaccharide biosynthesis tyrosine autokinase [Flavobacteriales bacterium]